MRGINKILLENILPAHLAEHYLLRAQGVAGVLKDTNVSKISILYGGITSNDGCRSKYFDLGQIESTFCCSVQVSHLWFGFEKFHQKIRKVYKITFIAKCLDCGIY